MYASLHITLLSLLCSPAEPQLNSLQATILASTPIPAPQTAPAKRPLAVVERRLACMGTWLNIEVHATDRASGLAASEQAIRAVEAVEARLSTWRSSSELSQLNQAAVGTSFLLSPELRADLELARQLGLSTGGAFDMGLGALIDAWDLRGLGQVPDAEQLSSARRNSGMRWLACNEQGARRSRSGLRLEEGGIGKGLGLDAAIAALRAANITAATVDLGGQLALLPCERPLPFGVAHPRKREQAVLALLIDGGSIATSGNSERSIEVDGQRYGHLLDPRTGRPVPDFGSVTVWARTAAEADALSTALYVMGPADGLAWAEEHAGIEALYLLCAEHAQGVLTAHTTRGLIDRIEMRAAGLRLAPIQEHLPGSPTDSGGDRR